MTESQRLDVIECLLGLEGSTELGTPWGQTRPEVSQLFSKSTPASLSALYMISYVYTGNYRHADAVALRGDGAQGKGEDGFFYVTSSDAVVKAYKSYHRWFDEVRLVGIESAKAAGLDPLKGSGLSWY